MGGFRVPSCVVRVSTPTVLEEVRRHFACDVLDGAELENQDTDECAIVGSHWEQRAFNGEVMAPVGGGMAPYLSRVTLALFRDSGWYQVNFSQADVLTKGVHWGYQQGCGFATEKCISDEGDPLWDRAYCTKPSDTACSLDRTRAMGCEMSSFNQQPPPVFDYLGKREAGSLAEMDYCPTYRVRLTNRVCTDPDASTPAPYTNINVMREVFGAQSRCLMGSLRKAVQANFFQTYYFKEEDFSDPMPACYHVECAPDKKSYVVKASKESGKHGLREIGRCSASGQELRVRGFEGSVACAAPEEICQVEKAAHVSARPAPNSSSRDTIQLYQ
jgi:leishmanolysin-like peptidase